MTICSRSTYMSTYVCLSFLLFTFDVATKLLIKLVIRNCVCVFTLHHTQSIHTVNSVCFVCVFFGQFFPSNIKCIIPNASTGECSQQYPQTATIFLIHIHIRFGLMCPVSYHTPCVTLIPRSTRYTSTYENLNIINYAEWKYNLFTLHYGYYCY